MEEKPFDTEIKRKMDRSQHRCCVMLVVFTILSLCILTAGLVLLFLNSSPQPEVVPSQPTLGVVEHIIDMKDYCKPSEEASRVGLHPFLEKCQQLYFQLYPNAELYFRRSGSKTELNTIARRFHPYMPSPEFLKDFADETNKLLGELNELKVNKSKLKPRESQTFDEIKVFLNQFMAEVYDIDFYGGDWMLGPNIFCMGVICKLEFEVQRFLYYFQLKTEDDIYHVIGIFYDHEKTFQQYRRNMELGVQSGFVKSRSSCIAGADALKQYYSNALNKKDGGAKTTFPPHFTTSHLPKNISDQWEKDHGRTVRESLVQAWLSGFVTPLKDLIRYIDTEHLQHCPPDDVAAGLSNIPLDYVWVNGTADLTRPTTKVLPLTNGTLDGKRLYRKLVPRFTTTPITPEEVFQEGEKQLKIFYKELIDASKKYTGEDKEEEAIKKMKKVFESDDMWHGDLKFPKNESDAHAHKTCTDDVTARKYCPVRWKSIQKWGMYHYSVMGMIHPQLNKVFHFTGDHASVPSCPIQVVHHYNPSNGAMFFDKNVDCSKPCQFALPFFLEKYGPKYWEWSVNGHESRPGHGFQYQGMFELFPYPCASGLPSFFHDMAYCTSFIEGWALYGENPLLSHDVDIYKDDLLQRIGMLKWQIWRSVRLVVDTGLHYRHKNRTWALRQFQKYTWDETDFGRKEITRYMSCPGQATAYMIGRLAILRARRKAEKELGAQFNLKDFHYQVLSVGQSPLGYLEEHIDRYVSCTKNPKQLYCDYMLTPVKNIPKDKTYSQLHKSRKNSFPMSPRRHHV